MKDFLLFSGWSEARHEPVAGDASSRSYTRLRRGKDTAILMQDPEGDVALFARLAEYLTAIGLSAPRILAIDAAKGLLLIEDLGSDLFAAILKDEPDQEGMLYQLATDVLLHLHDQAPPETLPVASVDHLATATDLVFDCYLTGAGGTQNDQAKADLRAAFLDVLSQHADVADVMILRDYHAENLLWIPDRDGVRRAGVLDFQDALLGHRAYDLISLLEDARRDVSHETRDHVINYYLSQTGVDEAEFRTQLCVLGAQRNLRILGVFARLAKVRGKPGYIDLVPRVWAHIQRDLDHPALGDIASIVSAHLPAPTDAVLERLKTNV